MEAEPGIGAGMAGRVGAIRRRRRRPAGRDLDGARHVALPLRRRSGRGPARAHGRIGPGLLRGRRGRAAAARRGAERRPSRARRLHRSVQSGGVLQHAGDPARPRAGVGGRGGGGIGCRRHVGGRRHGRRRHRGAAAGRRRDGGLARAQPMGSRSRYRTGHHPGVATACDLKQERERRPKGVQSRYRYRRHVH